ncbi:MAG: transporter substrate-binding domain-containing protein [Desulfobacterales bacterium]|nr:transporter substrate-binding domain-containing protein [Desulfobacterales bacterium]
MNKTNRLIIIALWAGLFLCGAVTVATAESPVPATIKIITPEWEGQANRDGTGLFFDIVRAVYGPAHVSMEARFAPWKRCQVSVTSAKADAMMCVWKARAAELNQLTPRYPLFVEQTAVVFKKASMFFWQGIHTMDYRRAVWLRGYDYHRDEQMASVQLARWYEVDSHEEAWQQLSMDRFDFYIDALIDLDAYIRSNDLDEGLYQKEILWRTRSFMAFSDTEKSRTLIEIFDREIQKLVKNGELARIYSKWDQPFFVEYW